MSHLSPQRLLPTRLVLMGCSVGALVVGACSGPQSDDLRRNVDDVSPLPVAASVDDVEGQRLAEVSIDGLALKVPTCLRGDAIDRHLLPVDVDNAVSAASPKPQAATPTIDEAVTPTPTPVEPEDGDLSVTPPADDVPPVVDGPADDGDQEPPADLGEPPAAPTVNRPEAGAPVGRLVHVAGVAEALAAVAVVVFDDDDAIVAEAEAQTDPQGTFAVDVRIDDVATYTMLHVAVMAENAAGVSDAVQVGVVHRPLSISGSVTQSDGAFDGDVVIELFETAHPDVPLQQVVVDAADGEAAAADFHFDAAPGQYALRARRGTSGDGAASPTVNLMLSTSNAMHLQLDLE